MFLPRLILVFGAWHEFDQMTSHHTYFAILLDAVVEDLIELFFDYLEVMSHAALCYDSLLRASNNVNSYQDASLSVFTFQTRRISLIRRIVPDDPRQVRIAPREVDGVFLHPLADCREVAHGSLLIAGVSLVASHFELDQSFTSLLEPAAELYT